MPPCRDRARHRGPRASAPRAVSCRAAPRAPRGAVWADAPMPADTCGRRRYWDERPGCPGTAAPPLDAFDMGRILVSPVRIVAGGLGAKNFPKADLVPLGRRPRRDEQCAANF